MWIDGIWIDGILLDAHVDRCDVYRRDMHRYQIRIASVTSLDRSLRFVLAGAYSYRHGAVMSCFIKVPWVEGPSD